MSERERREREEPEEEREGDAGAGADGDDAAESLLPPGNANPSPEHQPEPPARTTPS